MSMSMSGERRVPPGFRFHPTDEELVDYYLRKKIEAQSIDLDVIREVDLYKIEPWDLSERCQIGSTEQNEWYFFSHKDKKYPSGTRTNRSTAAGFWKATGRDKAIFNKHRLVGMRKTLVFYIGRAPNGQKTDWIMHEYRLENYKTGYSQEESWVVCRVFRKKCTGIIRKYLEQQDSSCTNVTEEEQTHLSIPEFESLINHFSHEDILGNDFLSCKQELEIDFSHSNAAFLQMPSLESPHYQEITTVLVENEKTRMAHNGFQYFPWNPTWAPHQQVATDWRVLDRMVASQLSQERNTKTDIVARHNETNIYTGEMACLLQQNILPNNDNHHNNNNTDLSMLLGRNIYKY